MIVAAPEQPGVQVDSAFRGKGLQKMADQIGRQIGDILLVEGDLYDGISPAADVHCYQCQGIVHGYYGVSHPHNALLFTQCLIEGASQAKRHVLYQVMGIRPRSRNLEVEGSVLGELGQQMVKHPDPGGDLGITLAVDQQLQTDAGLLGFTLDDRYSFGHVFCLLGGLAFLSARR